MRAVESGFEGKLKLPTVSSDHPSSLVTPIGFDGGHPMPETTGQVPAPELRIISHLCALQATGNPRLGAVVRFHGLITVNLPTLHCFNGS